MRRTTISRSRIAPLVTLALLATGTAARAQDTLQAVTPDTLQLGAQEPRPQLHVVQVGETLWGLAQMYFGDPLLWPEIYRLNTQVIEDPHWIYPGEELTFAGITPAAAMPVEQPVVEQPAVDTTQAAAPPSTDTTQVVIAPPGDTTQAAMQAPKPVEAPPVEAPAVEAPPAPPPPPPGDASAPTIFSRRRVVGGRIGSTGGDAFRYRPVRRGEFYSAGFLTEDEVFPWGRVRGDAEQPAERQRAETSSAHIFGTVELEAPSGATYREGDSLLVADLDRDVPGWGKVVIPSGILRVTKVQDRDILAEVITQFGRVVDGQVTIPLEPFHDPGLVTPVALENGLTATIVAPRDVHPVQGQQGIMFIDAGKEQGVAVGDLFEAWEPLSAERGETQQAVALLQIVHVRNRSASAFILQIYQSGIQSGQPVRLIRKMPS
jgi:nucleoid-associated protein YgaU